MSNNKLIVYTAIANKYDFLARAPRVLDASFILYTDEPPFYRKEKGWLKLPLPKTSDDPTRNCRHVKINPPLLVQKQRYSLWVDANIKLKFPHIEELIQEFIHSKAEIATFRHPLRNCIYQEAEACKFLERDTSDLIDQTVAHLKSMNYPKNHGLAETGVIFRDHHSTAVQEHAKVWNELLENFSKRDQLSFNFAAWQYGLDVTYIKGDARGNNPAFVMNPHREKGRRQLRNFLLAKSNDHTWVKYLLDIYRAISLRKK